MESTCNHPVCAASPDCLVRCVIDGCERDGAKYIVQTHTDGTFTNPLPDEDGFYCTDHLAEAMERANGYATVIRDPQGGRNLIRQGDLVHVKSAPGKRDGFDANFRRAKIVGGQVTEIEVWGGTHGRAAFRTFIPARIVRRSQRKVSA